MITITEATSYKLPFDESLFVSCDYNYSVIEFLNSLDLYRYNNKISTWEFPCTYLSKLVDNLCYMDDITIKFADNSIKHDEIIPIANYKTTPFNYQLDGIKYGLNTDKWLLLDCPGLGKTLQTIYIAEELHDTRDVEHCLIICGINELKINWKKEIEKHSKLSCKILGEKISKNGNVSFSSVADRLKQLNEPIDEFFIITNIETLRSDEAVKSFVNSKNKIDMIIFDEIHKIKDPNTLSGKAILQLKSKYMIGATGTLIVNNPLDAFVPLKWTGNISEISTITDFKKYFCKMTPDYRIVGYKNLDVLKYLIERCSLRRTKDLIDLPEKTVIDEYVEMSDSHRKFYDSIKAGIKEEADKIVLKPKNLRAMCNRLRQASACPSVLTTKNIISSKIERAVDLTEQLISNNEKVVIFSTYKESVGILSRELEKYSPIVVTGDTKGDISKLVSEFQEDDSKKVFIATWQKMGTGFTLNSASYMIFIDTPYTEAEFIQAQDRIHRIGSKNPVTIYNLMCEDTFDMVVKNIILKKSKYSSCLTEDIPQSFDSMAREFLSEILN